MIQLLYDGSFEGFLTVIFEAFVLRRQGVTIHTESGAPETFYERKTIETDMDKVERVGEGIMKKLGQPTMDTIESAWLTHTDGIEDDLFVYLQKCFAAGRDLSDNRTDPVVWRVMQAAFCAGREAQKMMGFVRFKTCGRLYIADIHPTNDLLPLLAPHFVDRFCSQPFVIRDHNHMRALMYDGHRSAICSFEQFEDFGLQADDGFERMWRSYYEAMAIAERRNPKLRRQLMPKKYWADLPELRDKRFVG